MSTPTAQPDYERFLGMVVSATGTPEDVVRAAGRERAAVEANRLICICLREKGYSLPEIGEVVGKNHTTVLRLIKGDAPRKSRRMNARLTKAHQRVATLLKDDTKPREAAADWSGEPADTGEPEWREALDAYRAAPLFKREKVWQQQMQRLFPHSWRQQSAMPPRAAQEAL